MRGPTHDAFVDGALEPEDRAAQVADGGEAPHQGRLGLSRRQQVEIGGIGGHAGAAWGVAAMKACQCASMRPGISTRPSAAMTSDVGVRVDGDRARRNALDDVAPHQHVRRSRQRGAPAVEDADVLKQRRSAAGRNGRRRRSRRFLRLSRLAKRHGEGRQHQPATQHLACGRRRQEQARPAPQTCTPIRRARCGLGGMHGSSRPPGRAGPRGRP